MPRRSTPVDEPGWSMGSATGGGRGSVPRADLASEPAVAESVVDARRARHVGRWIAAAVIVIVIASVLRSFVTDKRVEWSVVGHYFTSSSVLIGLVHTLELTALAMLIGVILGVILAVMRQSGNPVLSSISWGYISLFRGTPVLVQLIFWYNLSALYPKLGLGVPFGPSVVHGNVNSLMTPFVAALVGLGLNEGAYMAEIVRGGLLSVEGGQREAAAALGLTPSQAMRRIVLPQAMRVIIPPTGNQVIGMLKYTSLVSVIAYPDLLYSVQVIYARNYQTIPLLIVASIWYLIASTVLTILQHFLERPFAEVPRGGKGIGALWRSGAHG